MISNSAKPAIIALALGTLAACGSDQTEETITAPTPPAPPETSSVESDADVPAAPPAPAAPNSEPETEHADDTHDHAGGEAHVHGAANLSVSREGDQYFIFLEAPMANFGFSESASEIPADHTLTEDTVALIGGACAQTAKAVSVDSDGHHGSITVDLTYTCTRPDAVSAVQFTAFESYPGFEHVDAIYLTETGQKAAELTVNAATLVLN